jgi:TonB family protein
LLLAALNLPAQDLVAGAANLMHRAPIEYPADALEKRIQGPVTVEATLNERGVVSDARVTSGPDQLRRSVLKSVLDWHYIPGTTSPVQIAVEFKTAPRVVKGPLPSFQEASLEQLRKGPPPKWDAGIIERIQFAGLSPQFEETILSKLPVREGENFQTDMITRIEDTLKGFDEHLRANYNMLDFDGEKRSFELRISYVAPVEGERSAR